MPVVSPANLRLEELLLVGELVHLQRPFVLQRLSVRVAERVHVVKPRE